MKLRFIKALIIVVITTLSCESNTNTNTYQIKVDANGVLDGVRAYLNSNAGGRIVPTDTALVANGQFEFSGAVDTPEMRTITIDGVVGQLGLVLESGETNVVLYKDSIFNSEISGGLNNKAFMTYKDKYQDISKSLAQLREEFMAAKDDAEAVKAIQAKNNAIREKMKSFGFDFVIENPNSDFAVMLLEGITGQSGFDAELALQALDALPNKLVNDPRHASKVKSIKDKIAMATVANSVKTGNIAPDFTAPNPEGENINLKDILGQVTIIDFWASWCKPCRVENPNLVRVYNKYHEKGLEIISVSLDRENQKPQWINAIEKDQLDWYHVSNLKFWNDPIAKLYNITSIPATFILDENGVIVADRLRGDALENKIAELLN